MAVVSRRGIAGVFGLLAEPSFDVVFRSLDTLPRRRAVARRRANLAGRLRAVEELASLSEFAGGEVDANLHRRSAPWAIPTG